MQDPVIKVGKNRINTAQVIAVRYYEPKETRSKNARAVITTTAGVDEQSSNQIVLTGPDASAFVTLYDALVAAYTTRDVPGLGGKE